MKIEDKTLDSYLSETNLSLLATFREGFQGQLEFVQFMTLVREELKNTKSKNSIK